MLLVNVLLLNLLIAIFASRYDEIKEQAVSLWKLSRLSLVIEYKDKSILPVPFCIVNNILYLIKVMIEAIWILLWKLQIFKSKPDFDWGGYGQCGKTVRLGLTRA